MIVKEDFNEIILRQYSDLGYKIRQVETGDVYDEAYDLKPCKYTYVETEEKIEDTKLTGGGLDG